MNEVNVNTNVLVNTLMTKVNNLTSENLVQSAIIEELKMQIVKYQEAYPPQETEEEIKNEE